MRGSHRTGPALLGLPFISSAATLLFTCVFWRNAGGFWWLFGLLVTSLLSVFVLGKLKEGQALIRKNARALYYVLCGQLAFFYGWKAMIPGCAEIKYEVLAMIAGILWAMLVWTTIRGACPFKERKTS